MKEWLEVTFMKEWGKPLYISSLYPLDLPQNLFPCPSTGHLKFAGVQINFYIVNFLVCQSSCFIPISTMALNSSATVMTLHEQRVMTPSKMTLLLCWCKFFDDNTVDDFVSFVERSSVDVKNLLCSLNAAGKGADITHRRMTCSFLAVQLSSSISDLVSQWVSEWVSQ